MIIYSCQNDVLYFFKVTNSSDKDVVFIEYSDRDSVHISIQGNKTWDFPRDKRDPHPFESFIKEDYYIKLFYLMEKSLLTTMR
jgi:hypothetical protein